VLFARWFKDHDTWQAWFAFLSALFALPMPPEQRAVFERCTGRATPPWLLSIRWSPRNSPNLRLG
jgi:hypothetical protein